MSAPITPGTTWGRPVQPSGAKGKWHLLVEIRRNVSGVVITGRWAIVPVNGVFAMALCGQVLTDPVWDAQPPLVPYAGWGMPAPFPVPNRDWCLPCVEAAVRQAGSVPA